LLAAQFRRRSEEREREANRGFTTRAMREVERLRKARIYSHARLKLCFSDGCFVCINFLPEESMEDVRRVFDEVLQIKGMEYDFCVAPPRRVLDDKKTLTQEGLVPAARVQVNWKGSSANLATAGASPGSYIRKDLFDQGQNDDAFPISKPILQDDSSQKKKKKKEGQRSEEDILKRMMGGKANKLKPADKKKPSTPAAGYRLGGADSTQKKNGQGGAAGKPKWFK